MELNVSMKHLKQQMAFALLDLDEAKRIRALGWTGPILLLEGFFLLKIYLIVCSISLVSPFIVKRKSSG